MEHLYKVYPRVDINGILPNNKRITEPTVLPLNRKEFFKCMAFGEVYAYINGKEFQIKDLDYDKAESLFNNLWKNDLQFTNISSYEDKNICNEELDKQEEEIKDFQDKKEESINIVDPESNEGEDEDQLLKEYHENQSENEEKNHVEIKDKKELMEEKEEIITPKNNNISKHKHNNRNQKHQNQSSSNR